MIDHATAVAWSIHGLPASGSRDRTVKIWGDRAVHNSAL